MWTYEHNGMLEKIAITLCLSIVGCMPVDQANASGKAAADHLASLLEDASTVSFYFVSRTGNYSLHGDQFKDESTTRIYRNCGNNCRSFMREIISHLEQATLAECSPGQQNVLIEVGREGSLLYSYSGRMIEVDGKCYFNDQGIGDTIKSPEFLFD